MALLPDNPSIFAPDPPTLPPPMPGPLDEFLFPPDPFFPFFFPSLPFPFDLPLHPLFRICDLTLGLSPLLLALPGALATPLPPEPPSPLPPLSPPLPAPPPPPESILRLFQGPLPVWPPDISRVPPTMGCSSLPWVVVRRRARCVLTITGRIIAVRNSASGHLCSGAAFEKLSPGPLLVEQVAYKAGMQSVRDTLRKADEVRSTYTALGSERHVELLALRKPNDCLQLPGVGPPPGRCLVDEDDRRL